MRTAAAVLAAARTREGLRAVLDAAGFSESPVELTATARDALGVDAVGPVELVPGPGAIRILVLETGGASLRDALQRLARRLAARAPHVLWILAAVDGSGRQAGIVALSPERGPRVSSFLWEPGALANSDAETLVALAAVQSEDDSLFHARCAEVLGRDALTRRFYRALEARVAAMAASLDPRVASEDARTLALLCASRLLFLRFLEAKGWLDGDRTFLSTQFDACMTSGGDFHGRVLMPLFFGTLNTPPSRRAAAARRFGGIPFLNGGLFARSPLERRLGRRRFPDDVMGPLFQELFDRYRFVAREDSATWSEASVDPEMLGRAFESLMAESERRSSGVYYTPHALVARLADEAIAAARPTPSLDALRDVRVIDPACGSGAFLVHMLESLSAMRLRLGDTGTVASVRRDVLARSVFGVDRNPTAVWLCELRLWLSVVVESDETDPMRVPPLPNLDRNIRVGDALAGRGFATTPQALIGSAQIERLRAQYVRATGGRKRTLERRLDREERRRLLAHLERDIDVARHARREHLAAMRARDLFGERPRASREARRDAHRLRDRLRELRAERRRIADGGALPFSFHACFADAQARGGFDVVVGNPPWVRLHRIPALLRRQLRESYEVFRAAAWDAGAVGARASVGFASQVDLAALFVERSVTLLREGGVVGLLVPAKLWRSLSAGGVRRFLRERTRLLRLEDLSESRHAFDAAVYPAMVLARAHEPSRGEPVVVAVHDRSAVLEWQLSADALAFDGSPGSPWLLLPAAARRGFDCVLGAGPSLSSAFGAPRLGVKSGCNAAFLVKVTDSARGIASITDADGATGAVELHLLRPALRGDAVAAWTRAPTADWIVWTHDAGGHALAKLPNRAREWLGRRYSDLTLRSDAVHSRRWWSLFRVDAADHARPRVVWADIGRRPRAAVLPAGDPTVPMNSCYVLPCRDETDAWAVATLLNSRLSAAWLNAIAEPARGGYRRYLGWTVGLLPIPSEWPRAREILAAARGADDAAVLEAVLSAYGVRRRLVEALLQWTR